MVSRTSVLSVLAVCAALVTGCSHAQAPRARFAGEVLALGGVAGIVASALLTAEWSHAKQAVAVFSLVTAGGMTTYAVGELTDPASDLPAETLPARNQRWAKLLTQRASGAAREHKCEEVRTLELRVRGYDPEIHDFVLMRDPEVVRCLAVPDAAGAAGATPAR